MHDIYMMFDEQYKYIIYRIEQMYWNLYYVCMLIIYFLWVGAHTVKSFIISGKIS